MKKYKLMIKIIIFTLIIFSVNSDLKLINAKNFTTNNAVLKPYTVVVDLNDCKLFLMNQTTKEIIKTYTIAGGKPTTPSPVGTFKITDKGEWTKGFGTRWMGINVPWGKYGIHGTNKPFSIGSLSSQGCIRMYNKDVEELYSKLSIGTTVIIYGGPYCLLANSLRTLVPGNTGADVLEVQRKLKNIGYYSGTLDGIYGETTKNAVFKFKKDNNLILSQNIDFQLYKHLDIIPFE